MKIKYLLAASAAAFVVSGNVQAADVVQTYPVLAVATVSTVSASAFNWEGAYIGGQIGGTWTNSTYIEKENGKEFKKAVKPNGFIGGLYAGYNFDIGNNVVFGLDTDFVWAGLKKVLADHPGNNNVAAFKATLRQSWFGSTRLRAGYAADRWLPYISAGVAYSWMKYEAKDTIAVGGVVHKDKSYVGSTRAGWTVGTGVDYAMTDNLLLRAEYRYTDFGKKQYTLDGDTFHIKNHANDVRVGVAYKF